MNDETFEDAIGIAKAGAGAVYTFDTGFDEAAGAIGIDARGHGFEGEFGGAPEFELAGDGGEIFACRGGGGEAVEFAGQIENGEEEKFGGLANDIAHVAELHDGGRAISAEEGVLNGPDFFVVAHADHLLDDFDGDEGGLLAGGIGHGCAGELAEFAVDVAGIGAETFDEEFGGIVIE